MMFSAKINITFNCKLYCSKKVPVKTKLPSQTDFCHRYKAIFISEGELLNCSLLSKHTKFSKMGNYRNKYNINMFIKLRRLITSRTCSTHKGN